ncbi:MAG: phytanoyl-CoA hydroxylase [Flavobacterium sp.]|jgi:phytanoyl-CoA hydroxylase
MQSFKLSQSELETYRKHGFLVRSSVFTNQEIIALAKATDEATQQAHALKNKGHIYILDGKRFIDYKSITVQYEPGEMDHNIKVIEPVHSLAPLLAELIKDYRIVHPIYSILDTENISLWTDKLNLKEAKGSGFGWHQDSPYWVHDCDHVDSLPNVFVTFDDATKANGCLRIIRGSHKNGCLPGKNDGTQLGGFYTSEDVFDEADAVDLEAPAGSLVFFDPHSIHGSNTNTSMNKRRAMVITYQPSDQPSLKSKVIYPIKAQVGSYI